ncbi:DUF2318 domain-containing protein [Pseudodesulfovibrio profundus]|uniref:DUF2318 domain-containing protein n=1 Tax=Pseudodesulfovibrio profundus TaxID=57320 RepID=UPI001E41EDFC|nr:DUF2318 domain-containing protein [Pseudodesulfovibrio profundus]
MQNRLATIFMVLALAIFFADNAHALWGFGKYTSVKASNGVVTLPTADVNDGKAHYYSFEQDGSEVKFFVLKSSDGVIRAAFDACDVCFREKKGYDQDGEFMVCNNCGMRFHSSRINEVKGGCNPSPLTRTYDNDVVIFKAEDIMAGRGYF